MICSTGTPAYAGRKLREVNNSPPAAVYRTASPPETTDIYIMV